MVNRITIVFVVASALLVGAATACSDAQDTGLSKTAATAVPASGAVAAITEAIHDRALLNSDGTWQLMSESRSPDLLMLTVAAEIAASGVVDTPEGTASERSDIADLAEVIAATPATPEDQLHQMSTDLPIQHLLRWVSIDAVFGTPQPVEVRSLLDQMQPSEFKAAQTIRWDAQGRPAATSESPLCATLAEQLAAANTYGFAVTVSKILIDNGTGSCTSRGEEIGAALATFLAESGLDPTTPQTVADAAIITGGELGGPAVVQLIDSVEHETQQRGGLGEHYDPVELQFLAEPAMLASRLGHPDTAPADSLVSKTVELILHSGGTLAPYGGIGEGTSLESYLALAPAVPEARGAPLNAQAEVIVDSLSDAATCDMPGSEATEEITLGDEFGYGPPEDPLGALIDAAPECTPVSVAARTAPGLPAETIKGLSTMRRWAAEFYSCAVTGSVGEHQLPQVDPDDLGVDSSMPSPYTAYVLPLWFATPATSRCELTDAALADERN